MRENRLFPRQLFFGRPGRRDRKTWDSDLATVQRRAADVEQKHVDEGNEETGSLLGGEHIVCDPLVQDQNDQVSEQTDHEDNLGDEAKVDVQWLLEVTAGNREQWLELCLKNHGNRNRI